MAFSFVDTATGKKIFDVAESNIQIRSSDGKTVIDLVVDGKIPQGVLPAVPAAYTDAKAVAAVKAKAQIAALTAASTAADIVAALKA